MTLSQRILTLIANHPGITTAEIRAAIPDLPSANVRSRIAHLRVEKRIESTGHGTYRILLKRLAAPPPSALIPVPRARLMGGR